MKKLKETEPNRKYLVEYNGNPVKSLKTTWWSTLVRAGIYETVKTKKGVRPLSPKKQARRLRLYDFRHKFASMLLSEGADLKATSELLGHSTPTTTIQVYYHLMERQKREAISRLKIPELTAQSDT